MPRTRTADAEPLGHDSFLDVVANMVGILIILVMVVGMRAKHAPIEAAIQAATAKTRRELAEQSAAEQSVRSDVWQTAAEIERVRAEALRRCTYRDLLATAVSALEHEIREFEQEMDAGAKEDFELLRRTSEARRRLQELRREQVRLEQAEPDPVVLENRPTPLSHVVDNHEAHFQLRGGYIAYIPLEDLVADFKADARRKVGRLNELPEITETVGPHGGFRLRYTLKRKEVSPEVALATGVSGSYAQLERWTLVPLREPLGEPAATALAEGSAFREALARFLPGRSAVTIWIYPDSFDEFREVRDELYKLGYSVAGRPLPFGVPISGSPEGSKSAAQ